MPDPPPSFPYCRTFLDLLENPRRRQMIDTGCRHHLCLSPTGSAAAWPLPQELSPSSPADPVTDVFGVF